MKIGILGAGRVGSALGRGWAKGDHEIMFSARNPGKVKDLADETGASIGSVAETVAFGDVIVLAVSGGAAEGIVKNHDWNGKVLLDTMNHRAGGRMTSLSSKIHEWSGAPVAKVFNTIGTEIMEQPRFDDGVHTLFTCASNDDARTVARTLSEELGFEVVDLGGLEKEGILADMTSVWVGMAFGGFGRNFGFRLLRR